MVEAIVGGALIGVAAVWLYLSLGRIAGISGIVGRALTAPTGWAVLFIVGLGVGGWLARPFAVEPTLEVALPTELLLVGGLLVGFGTRLGSGCTSGHGVCGMARVSQRSIVATATFLAVGMLTATLVYG